MLVTSKKYLKIMQIFKIQRYAKIGRVSHGDNKATKLKDISNTESSRNLLLIYEKKVECCIKSNQLDNSNRDLTHLKRV